MPLFNLNPVYAMYMHRIFFQLFHINFNNHSLLCILTQHLESRHKEAASKYCIYSSEYIPPFISDLPFA